MRSIILSAAMAASAVAMAGSPALASGSGSGYSGSGESEAERLERRGKSQVRKRITCKKCSYHGKLNSQTASEVAQAVRNGDFDLSAKNQQAVLFYLRQRYGV